MKSVRYELYVAPRLQVPHNDEAPADVQIPMTGGPVSEIQRVIDAALI